MAACLQDGLNNPASSIHVPLPKRTGLREYPTRCPGNDGVRLQSLERVSSLPSLSGGKLAPMPDSQVL